MSKNYNYTKNYKAVVRELKDIRKFCKNEGIDFPITVELYRCLNGDDENPYNGDYRYNSIRTFYKGLLNCLNRIMDYPDKSFTCNCDIFNSNHFNTCIKSPTNLTKYKFLVVNNNMWEEILLSNEELFFSYSNVYFPRSINIIPTQGTIICSNNFFKRVDLAELYLFWKFWKYLEGTVDNGRKIQFMQEDWEKEQLVYILYIDDLHIDYYINMKVGINNTKILLLPFYGKGGLSIIPIPERLIDWNRFP